MFAFSRAGLSALLLGLTAPACSGTAAEPPPAAEPLGQCHIVDGDTLRCASERIRLLAIDAPELPGHCQQGRRCVPGDPAASTASLQNAAQGVLTIQRFGQDRYRRTLALVAASGHDLSCHQLASRRAIYRSDWDTGNAVLQICPGAAARATLTR